ncbi:MAG TPA: hypothetical protein VHN19_11105 [Burkholderiales bacterium]|jgi:hypothetical protein|nr:hypothetical protein [Burkholderiales bacterium]HEX2650474.1 hypothetical protein [Burkholderiales bacterium]
MQFTLEPKADLLHAKVWGRDTTRPPFQVCEAIMTEARRLGLKRILIELSQKVPLSGTGQFMLVERLPSLGLTPEHRIALVHHTPGFFEANDMIDMVAENRGLNVKNFRDVGAALAWLG